jgi:hypothetical protein
MAFYLLDFVAALAADFAPAGNANGASLTAFRTTPDLRHCVQTNTRRLLPSGKTTRTRCRFGLNFRRVIPVIFVPTPPKYFALPRVSTLLPIWELFLQTLHSRAMAHTFVITNSFLSETEDLKLRIIQGTAGY